MHRAADRDALALAAGEVSDRLPRAVDADVQLVEELASLLRHPRTVELPQRPTHELAPEEHVHIDRLAVREREILVDDLDPVPLRLAGAREADRLAVQDDLAGGRLVHAGDQLHERRLAGAVVADERDDLTGIDIERDLLERDHRAELLADAVELDERLQLGHSASLPSPVQIPATSGSPPAAPVTPTTYARVTNAWIRKPKTTVAPVRGAGPPARSSCP